MTDFDHKTYFEDIGAWPKGAHIVGSYVMGFGISMLLSVLAYLIVLNQGILSQGVAVFTVLTLAVLQFIAQVMLFLHLGKETASRDRLIAFGFALLIVTILVSGSVWIMFSLNARQMPTTAQMEAFMNSQIGI